VDIELTITFGNQPRNVKITQPLGSGGGYHLFIDNYFQGSILPQDGKLVAHLNQRSIITVDDLEVIFEIIGAKEKSG